MLHLPQAVRMDGVAAWQHRCRPHAVKEVLEAHRAVLPHAVLDADVVVLQRRHDIGCVVIKRDSLGSANFLGRQVRAMY